jgi:hypothetical protein
VDQARVETAIPWSRPHHLGHQANSLTPNLWHFATILPKERRETADSSESGQVSLGIPGSSPIAPDKDAL